MGGDEFRIRDELELLRAKQKLLDLEEKERRYRENNKIEFFQPLPHQQKVLDYFRQGKKIVLLQGANRIGKTTLVACFAGACCLGYEPWSKQKSIFDGRPVRGRIIGVDWEHHVKEVIVEKLKEWLPKGSYTTKKNNIGADYLWQFKNGSTIEIMTHIQDTKSHEGWRGHFVIFDEPPPKDKYIANLRGLVDTGGVCLMAFTAVYESWVLDDIVLKPSPDIGCITDIPMWNNPHLNKKDIDSFASAIDEDERVARVQGGWLQLQGKIFKEFDPETHIIKPFDIPSDYPVVAMIDLHLSEKQAIGFYAVDRNNINFVIDEYFENASPEEVAEEIKKRKYQNYWRIEKAYIDPLSKGDKNYFKNRGVVRDSFSIISDSLREAGILLEVASKDKMSGIRNIKRWFKGPNSVPILYIFDNCQRHIWEIQRWSYNKDGSPKDQDDHFCENLYRFSLTGTKYVPAEVWTAKLNYVRPRI